MRSTRLLATLTAAAAFGVAGPAAADTYCVGSPAACPAGATTASGVQAGLDAAGSHPGHDVVMIGAGTFTAPTPFTYGTANAANTVEVVGEGAATVLAADTAAKPGSFAVVFMHAPAPSRVRDLKVVAPNGSDQAAKPLGMEIAGGVDVESVEVTDSGALSLGADLGISIGGGDLRDSKVHMNATADGIHPQGSAPVTVSDTDVRGDRGIITVSGGDVTVRRTTVVAKTGGVVMRGGALRVESTLIRTTGTNGYGVRLQGYHAAAPLAQADLSHVTVVGTAAPGMLGIDVKAVDDGDAVVNVDNSIVSGFGHPLNRVSTDAGGEGAASLTAANLNHDPTADVSQGPGELTETGASNLAAGFRDAANGDFSIGPASPMVDKGRSASFVALDGLDVAGGQRAAGAQRDLGAYEYQAIAPVGVIAGAVPATTVGEALSLDGSGSHEDGDPGEDVVSWEWAFGDGTTATGASVTHAWTAPGTYEVALTVVDTGGQSHTATASVVVSAKPAATPAATTPTTPTTPAGGGGTTDGGSTDGGGSPGALITPVTEEGVTPPPPPTTAPRDVYAPAISGLRRQGRSLRFTLDEAATLLVRIERRNRARIFRPVGAPRPAVGVAGPNVVRLPALRPGRYRVVVNATDGAGNRSGRQVAFTVAR